MIGIIVFCFLFFGSIVSFAQHNEIQDISSPELSKMLKSQDGLISSSEMQPYQGEKSNRSDKNGTRSIYRKWKNTKTPRSPTPNTLITER
ncbi:MAG: hypothetical protein KJ710_06250 [Candidatus Omnitrophica bacterium]|nr:hypothetical protein [Candidatus Omnitrophota bacterium]MBU1923836.1 hypothetical protein [Candidatus Omnitrophota bacterium]